MAERSDAPLAGDSRAENRDESAPSGLPDEAAEQDAPLGPVEPRPEGEGEPARGEDAQPGITRGEPDVSG